MDQPLLNQEYFWILGKMIQKSIYPSYNSYLTKFGRLTLVAQRANDPRDYWWSKAPGEKPVRLQRKSIEVTRGTVKLLRLFWFRYSFEIGWLFNKYEGSNHREKTHRKQIQS